MSVLPVTADNGVDIDPNWHWQARLALLLKHGPRGTTLNRCRHQGPLYVQKPFYPEGRDIAHLYLLHPPGGLVSGDTLTIDVHLHEQAQALITTPGAARIYKSREVSPLQRQNITLTLESGASLEWFPMETIVYNNACAQLNTCVDLSPDSYFSTWEITCFGLPASQQLFTQGGFRQRYTITQAGKPLFIDQLHYDARQESLFKQHAGMQACTVSGFFIAGPFALSVEQQAELLEQLRACIDTQGLSTLLTVTFVNGLCISRYLGESANQARDAFVLVWEIARPLLLKRLACHPRIWLT